MEPIIVIALAALVWIVSVFAGMRTALEVERTIREAIDKGTLVDPAMIATLREPAGLRWVERFAVFGILLASSGGGIALVAIALVVSGAGMPTPLFVLALFLAILSAGFFACSRWLRQERSRR